jgi:hypothetical protein
MERKLYKFCYLKGNYEKDSGPDEDKPVVQEPACFPADSFRGAADEHGCAGKDIPRVY